MKKENSKILDFFRRNAAYLVLAFCVLAVGLTVAFVLIGESKNNDNIKIEAPITDNGDNDVKNPDIDPVIKPDDEPVIKVIRFIMPVNDTTAIEKYSESMVFNATLNRFSAHTATDFYAAEGSPVMAVYDGTVEKVENDVLKGVTVTIDHGDGLKTVYNSLADADEIVAGATVKQGDVIGHVSSTNRQESKNGAHLHFEVYENGKNIDPVKYLAIDEK